MLVLLESTAVAALLFSPTLVRALDGHLGLRLLLPCTCLLLPLLLLLLLPPPLGEHKPEDCRH